MRCPVLSVPGWPRQGLRRPHRGRGTARSVPRGTRCAAGDEGEGYGGPCWHRCFLVRRCATPSTTGSHGGPSRGGAPSTGSGAGTIGKYCAALRGAGNLVGEIPRVPDACAPGSRSCGPPRPGCPTGSCPLTVEGRASLADPGAEGRENLTVRSAPPVRRALQPPDPFVPSRAPLPPGRTRTRTEELSSWAPPTRRHPCPRGARQAVRGRARR